MEREIIQLVREEDLVSLAKILNSVGLKIVRVQQTTELYGGHVTWEAGPIGLKEQELQGD